jgi:S1-C subfamily serine protease
MRSFAAKMFCSLSMVVGVASISHAQDPVKEAGTKILDASKAAVVTVKMVMDMQFSMPGRGTQNREEKSEVTGVVLDATGLTVLSLASFDQSSFIENNPRFDEDSGFKFTSRVSSAKIALLDGTEVSAKVVLRDKDLDLAFLRPEVKAEKPFVFIDLTQAGPAGILDQVILVNRLGKVANRVHAASVDRIEAVVEKPRLVYIPSSNENRASFGSPAFGLDGKPIGIVLMRMIQSTDGDMDGSVSAIILPASDILEQAKEAPEEAEKQPELAPEEPAKEEGAAEPGAGEEKSKTITIKPAE